MNVWAPPPFRIKFDEARDPYAARNALGITGTGGSGTGGAPLNAEYITASSDATLTNERVLTNTATVTWDFSTPGQAKASTSAGGGGNVSNSGTPASGQYGRWVTATTIAGVTPAMVLSDIGAAPLASPTFTGDPKAPTPATADNDTSIATTAYVQAQGYLTSAGAASAYQPLDADLTSLAAAAATNAIYYRSAANTWATVTIGTGLSFTGGTLTATGAGFPTTAWNTYTPTLAAGSGTLTSASATGRFIQAGKVVFFSIRIAITTNGTAATSITATLPVAAFAASQVLSGYHETNTEVMSAVILSGTPTVATIRNSAGEYPGANGAAFVISGTYEAA